VTDFLMVYWGGRPPSDPDEDADALRLWADWYEVLGPDILDSGARIRRSTKVLSDGSVQSQIGTTAVTGYCIVRAPTLDDAISHAKACPVLSVGGVVEVCETGT
jgi:hypothetical protein